ncbi:MAG: hypothetical protein LBK52_04025, partial [Deltaproteobacteria bacterium]|nr:hypothetical protein [Deltaproteobacteria bacterium]
LDTALAYPLIKSHLTTFIPLGEVGLPAWLATYGRYNLGHTFWFYALLTGLSLLGLSIFACTGARLAVLLSRKNRRPGWLRKLGPHLMHYAVLIMLLGYLGSYLFAEPRPGRALIPDGPALKLPDGLGWLSASVRDPVIYRGDRLAFFQDWYLDPGIWLRFTAPDGQTAEIQTAYSRPARYGGYTFYLNDFYPKNAAPAGMGSYKAIQLTIRRDPAAWLYLAGMGVFFLGIILYLADLRSQSGLRPKGESLPPPAAKEKA